MAQCPVCQAEVLADFGLIECESCQAQLIVHVDGTVEHSGNASAEADERVDVGDDFADMPIDESYEQPQEFEAPAEDPLAVFDAPGEELSPESYRSPVTSDSPDLSDIAAFGNSDVSSAREGALRYNLRIYGIDTSDVREAFREAITDRKFMWDVDKILRAIHNGEAVIGNVSATKAYMLISRLRSLPVKIRWEQYAIHQA
ncbi:MAG: hypothetical protein KF799_01470 [Bdellovibrionales bacterium]|nr:hypothetical protein [Bdellovibrionales bacterium]